MKKPLRKRNIRSVPYAVEVLFDHPAQDLVTSFKNKNSNASEIKIAQLIAYVDQIEQTQTDGYWSVLREL
jgi:hypothetical protein